MKDKNIVVEFDVTTLDYVSDEDISILVSKAMQMLSTNLLVKNINIKHIDVKD